MVIRNPDYKFVVKTTCIPAMSLEENLQQFLAERPAINLSAFAKECAIDRVNFAKILGGLRRIPQAKRGVVIAIMVKYGFLE